MRSLFDLVDAGNCDHLIAITGALFVMFAVTERWMREWE